MEKLVTSIDQHGRMLIPVGVREKLNVFPGDKINLEIYENEVRIINANKIIDEMHAIFTKNQDDKKDSIVDDFINKKGEEYLLEQERNRRD